MALDDFGVGAMFAVMTVAQIKDLSRQPPRSPRQRLGEFVILPRTIDKCRAMLAEAEGEYRFDCPMDNMLFQFKGIKGEDLKKAVAKGASDEEVLEWLTSSGIPRSEEEIRDWSLNMERYSPIHDPQKRDFFTKECQRLGLDAATTSMFDWLEADDAHLAQRR